MKIQQLEALQLEALQLVPTAITDRTFTGWTRIEFANEEGGVTRSIVQKGSLYINIYSIPSGLVGGYNEYKSMRLAQMARNCAQAGFLFTVMRDELGILQASSGYGIEAGGAAIISMSSGEIADITGLLVGVTDILPLVLALPGVPYAPERGCMDTEADNYNPSATISDGSCTYTSPEPDPIPEPDPDPEVIPWTVYTTGATDIGSTGATLNGSILQVGSNLDAEVWFEYGTDLLLGSITGRAPYYTLGDTDFMSLITGLLPSTVYYYRVNCTDGPGHIRAFETAYEGVPIPEPTPIPDPIPEPTPGIGLDMSEMMNMMIMVMMMGMMGDTMGGMSG